jgi:hypothetical protein
MQQALQRQLLGLQQQQQEEEEEVPATKAGPDMLLPLLQPGMQQR